MRQQRVASAHMLLGLTLLVLPSFSGDCDQSEAHVALLRNRWELTRAALQHASRMLLESEFGRPAARYVEFRVSLAEARAPLLLKLAPDHLLPVTVLYFLRQVGAGLWDGAAFHRNAPHVLQAGPLQNVPRFESAARARGDPSWSVPVQEYSAEFPHVTHTVGLAGRPGGPDWYISTEDNSRNHGPGSQNAEAAFTGEADPCFAKLIGGLDTLRAIRAQPTRPGSETFAEHVRILSGRILSPEEAERLKAEEPRPEIVHSGL